MSAATPQVRLTPNQLLKRLPEAAGEIARGNHSATWPGIFGGLSRNNLERTLQRLDDGGFAKQYAHGGWEMTDKGRAELSG